MNWRPRRLRSSETIRRLVRETSLSVDHLVAPVFVTHGSNVASEISSMPGVYQYSVDQVLREIQQIVELKIPAILLFGIPEKKDSQGTEAYHHDGVVQKALRLIKSQLLPVTVMTDVCLCAYTDHGHCGIVEKRQVKNDVSVDVLIKVALSHVEAGADVVAPSDMMDGRVGRIRQALDERGYSHVPIMSYAAKFASSFYGPFREAQMSTPQFGDRKSYQMDPANSREALREAFLDMDEGADMIMVKPALPYLDIIYQLRELTQLPIAAYHVSGEYAMVQAAHDRGWLEKNAVMLESLTSIKRAGADFIVTYFAKEAARILRR